MKLEWLNLTALVLVIVGALNWGLVGLVDLNLVNALVGSIPLLEKAVYIVVGLAGLYEIWVALKK